MAKHGRSVCGTFSIEPVDPSKFLPYEDRIRSVLGVKYVPVPWLWIMFRLSEEDDLLLQLGIGKVYCKAVANARRSIQRRSLSVLSSEQIEFTTESMLRWAGVI